MGKNTEYSTKNGVGLLPIVATNPKSIGYGFLSGTEMEITPLSRGM